VVPLAVSGGASEASIPNRWKSWPDHGTRRCCRQHGAFQRGDADDAAEVSNDIVAMEHWLARVGGGFSLSSA
jgi:hypothetical protein